jgi:hypothetical protein
MMSFISVRQFMWILIDDLDRSIPEPMKTVLLIGYGLARTGGHRSELSYVELFDDSPDECSANVEVHVAESRAFRQSAILLQRRLVCFEIRDQSIADVLSRVECLQVPESIYGVVEDDAVVYIRHDATRDHVIVKFL